MTAANLAVMSDANARETRAGVPLTNLDQALFDDAGATKRDLVAYLDAVSERIIPVLENRALSVIRVHRGQEAFMQKNVPKYTPSWVRTVDVWAEASHRNVSYALCNDLPTLIWFANQRAIEYHPSLVRVDRPDQTTHLVLDLDPPDGDPFTTVVAVARLVRHALGAVGLEGAVKTSGAKGLHVFVPIGERVSMEDAAAATRADRGASRAVGSRTCDDGVHQGRPRRKGLRRRDAESVARRSSRRTARGFDRACPSRFRWPGTASMKSRPPTSPCTTQSGCSMAKIRGPS